MGELPNDMCNNITQLRTLSVTHNLLNGQLPSDIYKCSKLEYLQLYGNNIQGVLPNYMCNNITQLQYIRLHFNQISGQIPSDIYKCSELMELTLSNNHFNGTIPSSIGSLTKLRVLYLDENNLQGSIPSTIGNLSSLGILFLHSNKLIGEIPSSICNLSYLTYLRLSNNNLEGLIPKCLANCGKLEVIDIGNNILRDNFPFWIEALLELRVLVLRSNRFNGTLTFRASRATNLPIFSKLQVFDISHNEFAGSLPARYLENFKTMKNAKENTTINMHHWFIFYDDLITFVFKGFEYSLTRILTTFIIIDLSCNKFNRSIPHSIGNLNSLKYLNLSHNTLTEHIPASLGNIIALESLDLSSNKLVGKIPQELTKLTFLSKLELSCNNLDGKIPESSIGQFSTFENSSYLGNPGLCGPPLTKKCKEDGVVLEESPTQESDDSGFLDGFTWQVVALGYGCGSVVGIILGHLIFFRYGRPRWLVNFFFGPQFKSKSNYRRR